MATLAIKQNEKRKEKGRHAIIFIIKRKNNIDM